MTTSVSVTQCSNSGGLLHVSPCQPSAGDPTSLSSALVLICVIWLTGS